MMIGILFAISVIAVGWRLLTERSPDLRVERIPLLTRTTIICGDCNGEQMRPIKTRLTIDGRCGSCGGQSYELASTFAPVIAQAIKRSKSIPEYSDQDSPAADEGQAYRLPGNSAW